jgi:CRP/FNR family transcriptional regulator, nitrogen oxide reductase regulator
MARKLRFFHQSPRDRHPRATHRGRTWPISTHGDAHIAASGIAAVSLGLRSHFLDGLTATDRKMMLAAATKRRYFANSVMTNQGHPADHLFLLTEGLARFFFVTEEGRKLLFRWIGPGDLFGGRAILSERSTYLFSTETVADISVLVWDRPTIRGFVERHPRLLENALLTASDYVAWHLASHIGLACHTARQRAAQVLVTLARTIGRETAGGVELQITNEELANAANITAFTASRLMSKWQQDRALVKRRGKVLLRSPERLFLRTM